MNTDVLDLHLVAYRSLREALGFQMRAEKILLPEFVAYVNAQPNRSPIRAQMALTWACQASVHRGPSGAARRLSMARGFLRYLQASLPDTEVPGPGLLPTPRRPKPYLFTPAQITTLLTAAQASRPRGALRPYTLSSVLGLLASTGLRVGEAIRLQSDQVKLDLTPPQLHIRETNKFIAICVILYLFSPRRYLDGQYPLCRCRVSSHRVFGFHEPDPRGVSAPSATV